MTDPASLERALLHALSSEWHGLNREIFDRAMTPPVFSLSDDGQRLGLWRKQTREIVIQRALIFEQNWGVVVEVLKHEMAHQYVDDILMIVDEPPHGPSFQRVCSERNIDERAQGMPDAPDESRILDRISKLLALAGSGNQHEAEAAMAKAQQMMLKHNLNAPSDSRYSFTQVGLPKKRIFEHSRWLASILTNHFFVEAIWVPAYDVRSGQTGTILELCGAHQNLAIAEYVFDFLQDTAERLWREYRKEHKIRHHGGRRRFLTGVMRGFLDRLENARVQQEEKGLVWLGDADLVRYLHQRHPRTRTRRRPGGRRDENFNAGRAAGEKIILHRPMTESSIEGKPRQLSARTGK